MLIVALEFVERIIFEKKHSYILFNFPHFFIFPLALKQFYFLTNPIRLLRTTLVKIIKMSFFLKKTLHQLPFVDCVLCTFKLLNILMRVHVLLPDVC